METNYRFWICTLRAEAGPRYQLRAGLTGDANIDCVPVHRTAFVQRLPLAVTHATQHEAELELHALLAWLDARWAARMSRAA